MKGGEVGVQGLPVDCSNILLGTNLGQAQRIPSKDTGITFHEQNIYIFLQFLKGELLRGPENPNGQNKTTLSSKITETLRS